MNTDATPLPTLILHHPRIFTMAASRPWAEAISVQEGRIVAVGTLQEAQAALPDAQVVDLPGAMVVPGLLDVHNHFVWAGRAELYEMFVPPFFSLDQVLAAVRDAAAGKAPGEWIVGGIWGSSLMDQLDQKARKRLDEAAGGRPVMLRDDSHHNRFVSSAARSVPRIAACDSRRSLSCSPGRLSSRASSAFAMTVNKLLKSCAIPPASWPRVSIFWA